MFCLIKPKSFSRFQTWRTVLTAVHIAGSLLVAFTPLLSLSAPANSTGSSGDQVVVVYNTRVPESKAIAEHYATVRKVPKDQVVGLSLTKEEDIKRSDFRDDLQKPLAKLFADKGLWKIGSTIVQMATNHQTRVEWKPTTSKIRYLVLCYGVPLRIPDDLTLPEKNSEKLSEQMRRNGAAVDSELAMLPLIDEHLPTYGPLGNREFGATNIWRLHPTNGILMVARLDGPTPEVALHLVDKAIEAETNGLWGRAYFDLRNISDPGYKIGDEWIRGASEVCRRLGFETTVDENPGTSPPVFLSARSPTIWAGMRRTFAVLLRGLKSSSCPALSPITCTHTVPPVCEIPTAPGSARSC